MRIQIAVPEAHVTKPVLDGALEAVTRLNEQLIKNGDSPTSDQLIAAGAKWEPEPPGDEHFDHGALIAKRKKGDCDDWAPLHAATLRVSGEDPQARAIVKRSGPKRWHAVVQRSDGSIDDPSSEAGMPGPGMATGVRGSYVPPMKERLHGVGGTYIATPHLAMRPVVDRHGEVESWQARADLPWHWQPNRGSPADLAMVTLHRSPVSDQAVVGAVLGALKLGAASGYAHPDHLKRMGAIADACDGASWEDLAEVYGTEHANACAGIVEGFFGKALRKLGKVAKGAVKFATKNPLGKLATSFIPGAGLATAAFNMASPALKRSAAKQQHLPPQQRQSLPVRVAVPAPRSSSSSSSPGPVIVQPKEPNVVLLDAFADRLQRAYEFGRQPAAAQPSRQRAAPRTQVRPGTAYPR